MTILVKSILTFLLWSMLYYTYTKLYNSGVTLLWVTLVKCGGSKSKEIKNIQRKHIHMFSGGP